MASTPPAPLCVVGPKIDGVENPPESLRQQVCDKFTDTPLPIYTDACMTAATVPACYSNSHISADLNWFSSNDDTAYCACDDGSTKCNVGQLSSPAECATMCAEMTSLSPVISNAACQFSMTTNQYVANENNLSLTTLQTLNINSGETEAEYLLRAEQACMNDSSCIAITRESQTDPWSIVPGDAGWKVNEGPQDGWTTYTPPSDSNCTAASLSTANTTTYPFAACDMSKLNHVTGCGAVPGSDSSYLKNCVGCSVKDGELSCTSCSTCMGCNGETNPTWSPSSFDITTCTAGSDIVIDEASKGFKCSNPCGSSWSETKGAGNQQSMVGAVLCTQPYVYNAPTKSCIKPCPENEHLDTTTGTCKACTCTGEPARNFSDTLQAVCGTTDAKNVAGSCSTCGNGINLNTVLLNYGGGPPSPVQPYATIPSMLGDYESSTNMMKNAKDGGEGAVKASYKASVTKSTTQPTTDYWSAFNVKDANGNAVSDPWKYININNEIAKAYVNQMKQGVCYNEETKDKIVAVFKQLNEQLINYNDYYSDVCTDPMNTYWYSKKWFGELDCDPTLKDAMIPIFALDGALLAAPFGIAAADAIGLGFLVGVTGDAAAEGSISATAGEFTLGQNLTDAGLNALFQTNPELASWLVDSMTEGGAIDGEALANTKITAGANMVHTACPTQPSTLPRT